MTLNEWYRIENLFVEAKLAYIIDNREAALAKCVEDARERIEEKENAEELTVRMELAVKRLKASIANAKKSLRQMKQNNTKKFNSEIPKTDAKDDWMDGRWGVKFGEVKKHMQSENKLPVPGFGKFLYRHNK